MCLRHFVSVKFVALHGFSGVSKPYYAMDYSQYTKKAYKKDAIQLSEFIKITDEGLCPNTNNESTGYLSQAPLRTSPRPS